MTEELLIPTQKPRIFLPAELDLSKWENLAPFFNDLKERDIQNIEDLQHWLLDKSELEAVLQEYSSRIWIRTTCNTADADGQALFENYFGNIEPNLQKEWNELNIKFNNCPYIDELDDNLFGVYKKLINSQLKIFRAENVDLLSQINLKSSEYAKIAGAMSVTIDGEDMTLQKAALFLKSDDRAKREEVFRKIWDRRKEDETKLNDLFSELLKLRHKVATNAGYENFRDYTFQALGRFDYTVEDCYDFHNSIEKNIVPIATKILESRKERMQVNPLRPWDTTAELDGAPLKAFSDSQDLIAKSINCFDKVHPYFAKCIDVMNKHQNLDLESRKNKAPGGYMTPLYESQIPFIFMNGVGSLKDMITMLHEGGHAFHEFLTAKYDVTGFKTYPSEIAELASMSMELLTMDSWDQFFSNPTEIRRAKQEHLQDILLMLPWIALVDAYQHWIYTHPYHSLEERARQWTELSNRFMPQIIDWTGLEQYYQMNWQRQLHIFEIPFYYIEYGMAQLGAIAIYMNSKNDKDKTIHEYIRALSLGYTQSIPEVYKAAGIKFDFSNQYIKDLAGFVSHELISLN